jgi:hypothetical protein
MKILALALTFVLALFSVGLGTLKNVGSKQ